MSDGTVVRRLCYQVTVTESVPGHGRDPAVLKVANLACPICGARRRCEWETRTCPTLP